jgi:hypothetical protein
MDRQKERQMKGWMSGKIYFRQEQCQHNCDVILFMYCAGIQGFGKTSNM